MTDKDERGLIVELGDVCLGYSRNAFNWVSRIASYERIRFFGISRGKIYFGLFYGDGKPGKTTVSARLVHLKRMVKDDEEYLATLDEDDEAR